LDLIIIVRKPAVGLDFYTLEKSVLHLLRKANLWKK
jgi:ribonuclease P protein component